MNTSFADCQFLSWVLNLGKDLLNSFSKMQRWTVKENHFLSGRTKEGKRLFITKRFYTNYLLRSLVNKQLSVLFLLSYFDKVALAGLLVAHCFIHIIKWSAKNTISAPILQCFHLDNTACVDYHYAIGR